MSIPTKQSDSSTRVNGAAASPLPVKASERKAGWLSRFRNYLWLGVIFTVIAASVAAFILLRLAIREPFTGPTFTVARQKLQVTIVERGSLESAENNDIVVRIKAGTKGSTNASIIKWVVEDGKEVKAGELVVEFDDSGFQDQLKTQRNTVNKAKADWVQAQTDCTFQESQNTSDIKTAEVNWIQAVLELRKYVGERAAEQMTRLKSQEEIRNYLRKGFQDDVAIEKKLSADKTSLYLQDISDFKSKVVTARSDVESWLDRAKWSERMVLKGLYSPSQGDADASRLTSSEIALRKAQGDLDIYSQFEVEKNITKNWSAVKEAERAMDRVSIQAKAKMEQKNADEASKKSIYNQEDDRLRDMLKDEKDYKMYAPQKGMVVYFVPEQSRFGSGSQQSIVAQGEPVREGQKLMRIPNLRNMMVNARVHEAMVSKLRGEDARPTGSSDRMRLAFSFGRNDLLGLAAFQVGFDRAREKYKAIRDKEHDIVYPGQDASVRVDAYPGKHYKGHVKTVATVASQADFLTSDVKVYQTMVSIEALQEKNLKPGMSAEVTIQASETADEVLVMPIQAVVGNVAMGANRKCFVLDDKGYPHERDIVVGMSNDKFVEVTLGVTEHEKVVLNPRALLPEKTDMKPGVPGGRRGPETDGGGDKKGDKKKWDGKKKGSPGEGPASPGQNPGMFRTDNTPPNRQQPAAKQSF